MYEMLSKMILALFGIRKIFTDISLKLTNSLVETNAINKIVINTEMFNNLDAQKKCSMKFEGMHFGVKRLEKF